MKAMGLKIFIFVAYFGLKIKFEIVGFIVVIP